MASMAATKPGRDERRAAIIQIARSVFVSDGYAAASMSCIAARVGGSKATLYNYFPSKEDLFRAVVQDGCEQISTLLDEVRLEGGDFRTVLCKFAARFLSLLLADDFIGMHRMIAAETGRFPELGRTFFESGPKQSVRRVGTYFAAQIDQGELRHEDPEMMAQYFIDLCLSGIHTRRVWNVVPMPLPEEIEAHVARAVSVFMAAFGAPIGEGELGV